MAQFPPNPRDGKTNALADSLLYTVRRVSQAVTLLATDGVLLVDAGTVAPGLVIGLPRAHDVPGRAFIVKKIDPTKNFVNIATNGQDVLEDGSRILTLKDPDESVVLISDGASHWWLLAGMGAASSDHKVKVHSVDTTPDFLAAKLVAGTGITLTTLNPGANEQLRIASTGGGGTPGGADTDVQFNDGGAFGGDGKFTYTKTTGAVAITNGILALGDATHLGRIYGASSPQPGPSPGGLALNAHPVGTTTLGPFAFTQLSPEITTWQGPNGLLFGLLNGDISLKDDSTFGAVQLLGYLFTGNFFVDDDSQGGPSETLLAFNPTIQNRTGVARQLLQGGHTLEHGPTFIADGAVCTIIAPQGYQGFAGKCVYQVQNNGTLNITTDLLGCDVFDAVNFGGIGAGTINMQAHLGYRYRGLTGILGGNTFTGGPTVGFRADDGNIFPTGDRPMSFQSTGPLRQLSHLGPAVFGADAAPTGAFILEAIGDAHVSGTLTVPSITGPGSVVQVVRLLVVDNAGAGSPGEVHVNADGTSIPGLLVLQSQGTNDPPNAPSGEAILSARDNGSGKIQVVARFPSGASQVIATEP